ncbi:MAG: ATP-binding protein [Thermoleophilaceae bacterium]
MAQLETVTALFTDLAGSTGLATRVGPAAAEALRRDHFAILRESVEATGGREVKNVGDGLMVVFGSCSSAVACGVDMQQRIERRNRRADEQFAVRIGISMGEADVEEGDYFGPPVVEAARLCNAAAGGQVLCGDMVRAMARQGAEFRSVGELELKGLAEPFPAHEVAWQPAAGGAGSLPLPARLREVPPVGYVGREAEREGLSFLLDLARDGRRRVAFISGEPGIGKTRLATQLAVHAHGDGAAVLYGRCDEDLGVPYGPWVRALRHYVAEAPEEVLRAHAERHGGELARLVPDVSARIAGYPEPRQSEAETERYLLFGAVTGLLEVAGENEPLVLILDDLHWADPPSLSLLRHVATHDAPLRLLVLGTYRDSELASGHPLTPLLADLHREEGVSRIPLDGLDESGVVAIMEAAAGHEMNDDGRRLARAIVRETGGNPFFVGELLRHLRESGAVVQGDDGRFRIEGDIAELGLPQSVREVVGRRVERLSDDGRRALSVAAVIGRDFDVDLLARVLETDQDSLLDLLEEATAASVIDEASPVGRFTFAHALINHTLYEDLSRTRRARIHARVATELEAICGDDPSERVAELAHHWGHAATADEPSKAVAYARQAGERALEKLAPADAVRWFGQALDLQGEGAPADAVRCDLLIGLGEAQRQVGDAAHRETLLTAGELASELGDADRAARAAFANQRGWTAVFGQVDAERVAALERAVELDGLRNAARSARLISRQTVELQYNPDHEKRWALADEALALARESGDDRTLANVLFEHVYATVSRSDSPAVRALSDELLELTETLDDPALRVRAGLADCLWCLVEGNIAGARARMASCRAAADETRDPTLRWFSTYIEASILYGVGDLAGSERLADLAVALGTAAGQPDAVMVYGAEVLPIRVAQGRAEEVIPMIEQAEAENPLLPAWRAALAAALATAGRLDDAAAILADFARDRFEGVPRDQAYLTALASLAPVAVDACDTGAAAVLYELLEPWAESVPWNGATSAPQIGTYLGMLASTLDRRDLAERHLRASCEFHERVGLAMYAPFSRQYLAEALAARSDDDAARREATTARQMARDVGYVMIEQRADALLEDRVRPKQTR